MARYIDVEPISSQYHNIPRRCESEYDIGYFAAIDKIDDDLNNAPTADVAPVIHAHWIKHSTGVYIIGHNGAWTGQYQYECSNCKSNQGRASKYCPDCSAIMDNPTATLRH